MCAAPRRPPQSPPRRERCGRRARGSRGTGRRRSALPRRLGSDSLTKFLLVHEQLLIFCDLTVGDFGRVAGCGLAVPRRRHVEGRVEAEDWPPAEFLACFRAIQPQRRRLVGALVVRLIFHLNLGPATLEPVDQLAYRNALLDRRAEVPGAGKPLPLACRATGEQEISPERFQHVLPRPYRLGPADDRRTSRFRGAGEIGDDAVDGPVAAADDVARARG